MTKTRRWSSTSFRATQSFVWKTAVGYSAMSVSIVSCNQQKELSLEKTVESLPFATCGDCFCIPDTDGSDCLYDAKRAAESSIFSPDVLDAFMSQVPLNPYRINCNPYDTDEESPEQCQTVPPQDPEMTQLGETAVCAIHYLPFESLSGDAVSDCPTSYRLVTYASAGEALAHGSFITHTGACGVCSTTQDFAAYMANPDLTDLATRCVEIALLSRERGIQCFRDLGMTEDCARIWVYDGYSTRRNCLKPCLVAKVENLGNNGPPPQCALNDCILCDEEKSGPLFKQVAGRTRRRSGLLSLIARPCSSIADNIEHDPCPLLTTASSSR